MDFFYAEDMDGTPGGVPPGGRCGAGGAATTVSVWDDAACDDKENLDPRFAVPLRAARQAAANTPGAAAAAARDAEVAVAPQGAYVCFIGMRTPPAPHGRRACKNARLNTPRPLQVPQQRTRRRTTAQVRHMRLCVWHGGRLADFSPSARCC